MLRRTVVDPEFEKMKNNLVQSITGRLEEEVVKELVNALYHFAMTRLNPDDVTVSTSSDRVLPLTPFGSID